MKKWMSYSVIFVGLILVTGIVRYWLCKQPVIFFTQNGIRLYQSRDKAAVKQLFADNLWYLVSDESVAQGYSVDFMLDHKSSVQHVKQNDLVLKVMEQDGRVMGFSAVFKPALYWGQVLFIVVDKEYRGQGHAKTLLLDALRYLFDKEHCVKVTLVTRIDNTAARALYEKVGFQVYHTDQYVDYILYKRDWQNHHGIV